MLDSYKTAILQRYSGFGGLKAVLFPHGSIDEWKSINVSVADLKLHPQVMELHEIIRTALGEEGYQPAIKSLRKSILSAFYTPDFIPATIFKVIADAGISVKNFYEPSAGTGVFVHAAISAFPDLKKVAAVEMDLITGGILGVIMSDYQTDVNVKTTGFEEATIEDNGNYDLIASNIPFGASGFLMNRCPLHLQRKGYIITFL